MQLEELTNQYRNAHKLTRSIDTIRQTNNQDNNPWNETLVRAQAQLLLTRYAQLKTSKGHKPIRTLIHNRPAQIYKAFNNTFSQEELIQQRQDSALLTQQRAQAIIQYLGRTNLQESKEEEKMTPKTREILKDLYQTIIQHPESINYDPTSESQVTALDKAWYFGTRQDEKTEATPPDEAKKIIAEMKAELLKEMEAMQKT